MRTQRLPVGLTSVFLILFPAHLAAQQTPLHTLKIPDGTVIRLSLLDSLSSATNEVDNPVNVEVTEDVKVVTC